MSEKASKIAPQEKKRLQFQAHFKKNECPFCENSPFKYYIWKKYMKDDRVIGYRIQCKKCLQELRLSKNELQIYQQLNKK